MTWNDSQYVQGLNILDESESTTLYMIGDYCCTQNDFNVEHNWGWLKAESVPTAH
jgi:hypothetical protein